MNRLSRALTVAALLAVGGVAIATAPTDDTIVAPFLLREDPGTAIEARLATVVVHDVALARELDISYGYDPGFGDSSLGESSFGESVPDTVTTGVWVVVSLDITARYVAVDFSNAEVRVDGVRYRASTVLPDADLQSFAFDPGVTVRGSIVFELPASAVRSDGASDSELVFLPRLSPVLDTVPTVDVDLRALAVDDLAVITEARAVDGAEEVDG